MSNPEPDGGAGGRSIQRQKSNSTVPLTSMPSTSDSKTMIGLAYNMKIRQGRFMKETHSQTLGIVMMNVPC